MKRGYLVLGPESSGTRLVTSLLMTAGCLGSSDHWQWWDVHEFEPDDNPVVWRRSFPHAGKWPYLGDMVRRMQGDGYEVQAVVVVREHHSLIQSKIQRGFAPDEQTAKVQASEAYRRIFSALDQWDLPTLVLTYEGLVQRPREVQDWLAYALGLPGVPNVRIEDMNKKYYEC